MESIGFVGLGVMGLPMAANLVKAGHDVAAYVRSEPRKREVAAHGVRLTDSIPEVAQGAATVITMLPDSPDVRDVAHDGGLLNALAPGSVWLEMSTIEPAVARDLHEASAQREVGFLDAPVSGGEAGAVEGSLSIMVGGNGADLEKVREVLDVLGATVVHVGDAGTGQVVKAANQIVVAGNIQVLAEAIAFLRAHGADLERALDVIGGGLAGSTVLERKRRAFLDERYAPGFRLVLHDKDLGIVERAARGKGVALPTTALVSQFVRALVARGDGDLDHSALAALAAELGGIEAAR